MNKRFLRTAARFHSQNIDRLLLQENEHRKRELQLLLIGLPKSGKNTFNKQLRIHYGDGFPASVRKDMIPIILANVANAVTSVLDYMNERNIIFADGLAQESQDCLFRCRSEDGSINEDRLLNDLGFPRTNIPNMQTTLFNRINKYDNISEYNNEGDNDNSDFDKLIPNNYFTSHSFTAQHISNDQQTVLTNFMSIRKSNSAVQDAPTEMLGVYPGLTNSVSTDSDEAIAISDKFLRYFGEQNTLPPSVIKKLELVADSSSLDNLQDILTDKSRLQKLLNQLLQCGLDNWSMYMGNDSPPPGPTSPPPACVEDELLDCLIENESDLSVEDNSSEVSSGPNDANCWNPNPIESDELKPSVNSKIVITRKDDSEMIGQNLSNTKTKSSTVNDILKNVQCNGNTNNVPDHSDLIITLDKWNAVNGETVAFKHTGKIPLRTLKLILKIVTDQPEFRKTMEDCSDMLSKNFQSGWYFIKHLDRIIQEDYLPTLQDILITHQSSKAIREMVIPFGTISLRTIDLAGQSKNLYKKLHYFECVNTVLFFISLPEVYETIQKDKSKDETTGSFALFESFLKSPDLCKKDFVIFLNKKDILKKSFEDRTQNNRESLTRNTTDVVSFIEYIKDRLLFLREKSETKGGRIYFHVICSLDIDEMKCTIRDCLRIIFETNRKRHAIL